MSSDLHDASPFQIQLSLRLRLLLVPGLEGEAGFLDSIASLISGPYAEIHHARVVGMLKGGYAARLPQELVNTHQAHNVFPQGK